MPTYDTLSEVLKAGSLRCWPTNIDDSVHLQMYLVHFFLLTIRFIILITHKFWYPLKLLISANKKFNTWLLIVIYARIRNPDPGKITHKNILLFKG